MQTRGLEVRCLRRLCTALALGWLGLGIPAAQAGTASRLLVLSAADEAAYADGYAAIEAQDWPLVDLALRRLADRSLEGALRARLLAHPAYPAAAGELEAWFARYGAAQTPPAALLTRARSLGVAARVGKAPRRAFPNPTPQPPDDSPAARAAIEGIAQAFAANDLATAEQQALAARAGPRAGEAEFWLGLISWRKQAATDAAGHFQRAAAWPHHGQWEQARAHVWSARALFANGGAAEALAHLRAASQAPHTLYGQIAEAQLGRASALDFRLERYPPAVLAEFAARHPGARRAAALAQLGRLSEAEEELETLHGVLDPNDDKLFLAFAEALAAPRAQLRAAEYGGPEVAAGHCPTHSFAPLEGVTLDPAALAAVMRQESRFTPVAVSRSRAQGLMQLLPSTANDLAQKEDFRRRPERLHDPALNVALGDRYLAWLLERPAIDNDLLRAIAAYNGGPGWLQRWLENFPAAQDPWMLLESLPRPETRTYAARVFAFYALCRFKNAESAAELDKLASGRAPILPRAAR